MCEVEEELNFSPEFEDQIQPSNYGGYYTAIGHPAAAEHPGNTSAKRLPSPSQSPLESEPPLKRIAENRLPLPPSDGYCLEGYSKLDLPQSFPLRRTVSTSRALYQETNTFPAVEAPPQVKLTAAQETRRSPNAQPQLLHRTVSDPAHFAGSPPATVSGLPPRPRNGSPSVRSPTALLHRTVSDPAPFSASPPAIFAGTPPRPMIASPSPEESHSAKRLRRMKERVKEMKQWCDEVVLESDEEETPQEQSEGNLENSSDEAVSVEENGDLLALRFKCNCGRGFEVLLSGKNCYYKITN